MTIFKENCWVTASDLLQHFERRVACFISSKSTNCLRPPETAVDERLIVFALKIFKVGLSRSRKNSFYLLQ